ncbi:thioredoxin-like protein [Auriculariales sp. MPI-PUGE-AT-0066]|nr:thioredoxin-like protein [Auriculariales sp. MPI-PUGE-AT-0066]
MTRLLRLPGLLTSSPFICSSSYRARSLPLRSLRTITTLGASGSKPADPMSLSANVDSIIAGNDVTVFSKTHCPYCRKAKALINGLEGIKSKSVKVIELDEDDQGSAIQAYLQKKTGQRTVPNIFINQQHIGGCDDIHDLHRQGKLLPLLNTASKM